MRRAFPIVLPTLLAIALFCARTVTAAEPRSDISPATVQYLALRRASPPTAGLTLATLAPNPRQYRNQTLEISGKLIGVCSAEDGLTRLMLQTDTSGTLSLTVSHLPEWVRSGERLRVLAIVTAPTDGDEETVEIGVPEMEVVAIASAWDLQAMEKRDRMSREAQAAYNSAVNAAKRGRGRTMRPQPKMLASRSIVAPSYTSAAANGLSPTASAAFPAYKAFIQGCNRRLTASQASDIAWAVLRYSEALDTDPRLVVALIIAESDFDPNSTSHTGAMGLGQLMPGTAREIAAKTGLNNPYDPVQNVAGSIYLLRSHLDKYSGGKAMGDLSANHIALALAAYNAGPGAVKKYGGIPPYRETQNYVKKINRIYRELCGQGG